MIHKYQLLIFTKGRAYGGHDGKFLSKKKKFREEKLGIFFQTKEIR